VESASPTGKRDASGLRAGLAAAALAGLLACRSAAAPSARPAVPPPAPAATAPPSSADALHNTLTWKTDDVSNLGYDVYRSESEAGPFVKVNERPVPGTLKPGKVQTFQYEDRAIDPRKDYWYYVECITLQGERLKFTPTLRAPAKVPTNN
jgi:hypothetical protein